MATTDPQGGIDNIWKPVEELFIAKCKLCSAVFSFDVATDCFEASEAKRGTLLELIELMDQEKQNESSTARARASLI